MVHSLVNICIAALSQPSQLPPCSSIPQPTTYLPLPFLSLLCSSPLIFALLEDPRPVFYCVCLTWSCQHAAVTTMNVAMDASTLSPALISRPSDLCFFLSSIPNRATLYLDLAGKNVSRNGTLCIITILVHSMQTTRLIDVQTLGASAFTTPGANGKTLKAILEDPHTLKCLWDIRNDADALWAHYQIRLAGVLDVQLLENASRVGDKTYLHSLDKSIENHLTLNVLLVYRMIMPMGVTFDDVFARRPVDESVMQYCVTAVTYLPALRDTYTKRIDVQWMEKATAESARRVDDACAPTYEPQSEKTNLGPWGSGLIPRLLTLDEWLEAMEEERQDETQREMLEPDYIEDYDDDLSGSDWGNYFYSDDSQEDYHYSSKDA